MKKRMGLLTGALCLAASPLAMSEQLSVNASLSTDYVFRYISQTLEEPALSGGVDWESGEGLYLGVWASNVDFDDDARLEMDFYGGYRFETDAGWGFDVGLIDYEYFDDQSNGNILEGFASVSRGNASVSVYTDLKDHEYYWLEGGYGREIGPVTANLTLGALLPDEGDGYVGWSVGASKSTGKLEYGVTAFGTNNDGKEQFGKLADTRVVLSISTEF